MSAADRSPPRDDAPDALLFDLGGVLVEIDFARVFRAWAGRARVPVEQVAARFAFDAAYERFERGEIEPPAYFASLRHTLGIALDDAAFIEGWNAIFVGEAGGVRARLGQLCNRRPLYVLSNTNVVHHAYWSRRFAALLEGFDAVFVSCVIGARKPEAAAFEAVAQRTGIGLERMLFFDDTATNVEGARACGLRAVHVPNAASLAAALERL